MESHTSTLTEQVSLLERGAHDAVWKHRLCVDEPVAQLGETFVLNCQVTPSRSYVAELVPVTVRGEIGDWLRHVSTSEDDESYRDPNESLDSDLLSGAAVGAEMDSHLLSFERLGQICGLDLTGLPQAYEDWRLCIELYVLHGRTLYLLSNGKGVRYKVLTEPELGSALSRRLLPLLPDDLEPAGPLVFAVSVPARSAALGGLRGYRWGIMAGGMAFSALSLLDSGPAESSLRWLWDTEFYDDAACRVLGIDGVERIPLVIGAQVAEVPRGDS